MSTTMETWKEWKQALEAEIHDIEAAADVFGRAFVTVRVISLGETGNRLLTVAEDGLLTERDRRAAGIRSHTKPLRDAIAYAKWLGDPKRAAVLEVVSQPTFEAQHEARRTLTKVAKNTISTRCLWRPSNPQYTGFEVDNARIDRIVAGARLYAATKGKP